MTSRDKIVKLSSPTLVRADQVPRVLWGDHESRFVNDLFHVLSDQMAFVTVTIPPGGYFRSSDKFRPYYDVHECQYVLKGQYTCQDPETGETHTVRQGDVIYMPEKRWHYGYNFGTTDVHLLECISRPADHAALADAPRPQAIKTHDPAAFLDYPRNTASTTQHFRVCRLGDAISVVIGDREPILFEVIASTAKVFFAEVTVSSGKCSDDLTFPFDICYYGKDELYIQAPEFEEYYTISEGDVAFLPSGCKHRIFNHGSVTMRALIGGSGTFGRINQQ